MSDVTDLLERLDALRAKAIAADEQREAYREKGDPHPDMDEEYAPVAVLACHASLDGNYSALASELRRLAEENGRLTEALATVQRSGAPGGSILARRADDHRCGWCRGMYTPCPVQMAGIALAKGGGR